MTVDHTRWVDSAGAYVLGAMAPDERAQFETHLVTCAICSEEVDELQPAAEALPMASPPMAPPTSLKDRIMAEVEREAELLARAGPSADRPVPEPARRRRGLALLGGWRLAPVAAALLIAGALAGTALDGTDTRTVAVSVDREQAPEATATLQIEGDTATLVAADLPTPPDGRVYEVWVMPDGSDTPRPTNALFLPRTDGSAAATIPGDASDMRMVLVTHEPPGGSDAPTAPPLLSADVS